MNRFAFVSNGPALAVLAAIVLIAPGCASQMVEPELRKTRVDLRPTADIRKVVVMADIAANDSDGDGVADQVRVFCFLFPSLMDTTQSLVGRGSFRLEIYDFTSGQLPPGAVPLAQANFNCEQSRDYLGPFRGIGVLPAYHFPVKVGALPPGVQRLLVTGRFFPEGGTINGPANESEPGTVEVPVFTPGTRSIAHAIAPRVVDRAGPRVIQLRPRQDPATQGADSTN